MGKCCETISALRRLFPEFESSSAWISTIVSTRNHGVPELAEGRQHPDAGDASLGPGHALLLHH